MYLFLIFRPFIFNSSYAHALKTEWYVMAHSSQLLSGPNKRPTPLIFFQNFSNYFPTILWIIRIITRKVIIIC